MVSTAASTIHFFTGNNIGPTRRTGVAQPGTSVSTSIAPTRRTGTFRHPDPIGWTEDHRAEIMAALYTILLGNPQLKAARDAPGKTRFKMWWRLVGSAVEHAARLAGQELDFKKLFLAQEEDDEESASLADVLERSRGGVSRGVHGEGRGRAGQFQPDPVSDEEKSNKKLVRDFLLPGAANEHLFSAKSIGRLLKKHLDNAVMTETAARWSCASGSGKGERILYRVDGAGDELDRNVGDLLGRPAG